MNPRRITADRQNGQTNLSVCGHVAEAIGVGSVTTEEYSRAVALQKIGVITVPLAPRKPLTPVKNLDRGHTHSSGRGCLAPTQFGDARKAESADVSGVVRRHYNGAFARQLFPTAHVQMVEMGVRL